MWFVFAMLSAVFAALTSILAKIGIENVNSNLATAIRTLVVLVMAWGIVLITGKIGEISNISGRSWLFLVLSGVATGLSWLCYYYALQQGDASKVGAGGQVQRGDLPGAGLCGAPRAGGRQDHSGGRPHHRRHVRDDFVKQASVFPCNPVP